MQYLRGERTEVNLNWLRFFGVEDYGSTTSNPEVVYLKLLCVESQVLFLLNIKMLSLHKVCGDISLLISILMVII